MERIEEWRLFTTVARLQSFSRAAKAHECSPQAVTRAIAAIERRLGVRLFHRTTRTVSLTAEGERYLGRSLHAIAEVDALESRTGSDVALQGVVSVTAPVLFGQMHVAPVITEFVRRHAEVSVRLALLDRVVSLAEEGIDIAFRIGVPPDSALRVRLLGQVRWVLCASPAYVKRMGIPRTPDDLEDHDCVAFTGMTPIPNRWSFARAGGRRRSVAVRARFVVNDGRAAIEAALAGVGVVRLLSYQVDALVRRGKLRLLLEAHEPPALPVHLMQLPGISSRVVTAFVDHAFSRLREDSRRVG
jgi:DNA-binding transcriptional LysR family regulator